MNGFIQAANSMTARLLLIGFLVGIMLVPMMMVKGTIEERGNYYHEAVRSVSDGWAGDQSLADPVLVIPYTYKEHFTRKNEDGTSERVSQEKSNHHLVFPEDTKTTGNFHSESRKRGLFSVPIYDAAISMTGGAVIPAFSYDLPPEDAATVTYGTPYIAVKLGDPRGLHGDYKFMFNGADYKPEPGMKLAQDEGIHIPVTFDVVESAGKNVSFDFNFQLKGTNLFSYFPHARQSELAVESNWPHPSFAGKFLPATHDVRTDGFNALWSVGALASGGQDNFSNPQKNVSVSFIESVNLYGKMLRAAKYGVLFLTLTFGAFFVTEVLRRFRIHPVQYLMVGGALSMFYLLLLALAEHIGFANAYIAASLTIALLLGFYTSAVAHSRKIGALFGAGILALYAALYGILGSEDYALLLGTGLLFTVLAAAMILTRRIDWYAMGAPRT